MFGRSKKRRTKRIDTLIGANTLITGSVRFQGGLRVDGTVKGDVVALGDDSSCLCLSEKGVVEGEVRVPHVSINGSVEGNVYGSEHVELCSKAQIKGDVYYNMFKMETGAEVNGKLSHDIGYNDASDPSLEVVPGELD